MSCQSSDPALFYIPRYSIGPLFLASLPWEYPEPILVYSSQHYHSLRCTSPSISRRLTNSENRQEDLFQFLNPTFMLHEIPRLLPSHVPTTTPTPVWLDCLQDTSPSGYCDLVLTSSLDEVSR